MFSSIYRLVTSVIQSEISIRYNKLQGGGVKLVDENNDSWIVYSKKIISFCCLPKIFIIHHYLKHLNRIRCNFKVFTLVLTRVEEEKLFDWKKGISYLLDVADSYFTRKLFLVIFFNPFLKNVPNLMLFVHLTLLYLHNIMY